MTQSDKTNKAPGAQSGGSIKYSICALLDLQGFSSHLEISGYDLRTDIGEKAIARLVNLEDAIERLSREHTAAPAHYPLQIHVRRLNDAIVICMDLDDMLVPSVGQTVFRGLSASTLTQFFGEDELADRPGFAARYEARIARALVPLHNFLGLIARIHLFVQKREAAAFHPGAKTVVCTGFRKPFVDSSQREDPLSANFALANAYLAERQLHGPHLFLDNHAIELAARDRYARNLLRLAHFHWEERTFNTLTEEVADGDRPANAVIGETAQVTLFRRSYDFLRVNPSPLSYLQHLDEVRDVLGGGKPLNDANFFYTHIAHAMQRGMSTDMIQAAQPPRSFIFNGTNDLDTDVRILGEFLRTGESPTQEASRWGKHLADFGMADLPDDSPLVKEVRALLDQKTTLELETFAIEEFGEMIWSFSESMLNTFLPLIDGPLDALLYPTFDTDRKAH